MSTAVADRSAPVVKRGWWGRNWKWAAPLALLVLVVGGGLIVAWPIIAPRFHERYQLSLSEIQKSPAVVEKLGEPVVASRPFPGGSITKDGDRGEASFNFDVEGPKGKASVSSKSRFMLGQWGFTQLELTFADNQRIDLANAIQAREGDDTPKFNPNEKAPEVAEPDLPKNIEFKLPPTDEK